MDLLAYRDRFPIVERTTYLINHSLGAMPATAEARLLEYARMWRERGIRAWGEEWWALPLTFGDSQRTKIVFETSNFPSVRYVYQAQPRLEVVACETLGELLDAIDERTL